jgi:sugar lactone lactonase YvrE
MCSGVQRWWRRSVGAVASTAVLAATTVLGGLGAASAAAITRCPWDSSRVATGLGSLENLGFDGAGAMLVSRTINGSGQLYRLTADGQTSTLVPNVVAPGGITIVGRTAYFTTGNNFVSGILGIKNGAIERVDLDTAVVSVVATGLTMPNGMVRLSDGTFIVSRNLGWTTGLTEISADGVTEKRFAPGVTLTNGLAYDAARNVVIASLDLHPVSTLALIDLGNPDHVRKVDLGLFGLFGFPDDLAVGPDDLIYMAMDGGDIVRIDPDRNSACVLASGLFGSTSVRFGAGPGWDSHSLYSTDLGGTVHKFTPRES